MKKLSAMMIILILILTACAPELSDQARGLPSNESSLTDEIQPDSSPLDISSGPVCPAYTPKGDVAYASEWTGEYPEIESYDKSFKTATFGMG
ncbi:hypothetical protein [Fusibacter sp. JL216-2]|uniref:hypothetical protein n=1 Tax=Fusibacter sp. JL216-2 TaxID=3071453 RepID=UPI003D337219